MTKLDIPEGIIALLTNQIAKNNAMLGDLTALVELQGEVIQNIFKLSTDAASEELAQKTYDLLQKHVADVRLRFAQVPVVGQINATDTPIVAAPPPPKPKRVVVNREALFTTAAALIKHAGGTLRGDVLFSHMPPPLVADLDVKKFGSVLSWSGKFTRTKEGWQAVPRQKGKARGPRGPLGPYRKTHSVKQEAARSQATATKGEWDFGQAVNGRAV